MNARSKQLGIEIEKREGLLRRRAEGVMISKRETLVFCYCVALTLFSFRFRFRFVSFSPLQSWPLYGCRRKYSSLCL